MTTHVRFPPQASTHQMGVLLLFNNSDELATADIVTATGLDEALVSGIMQLLLKARLVQETSSGGFSINKGFKSKKMRLNINLPVRSEQRAEAESTHKDVEEVCTRIAAGLCLNHC